MASERRAAVTTGVLLIAGAVAALAYAALERPALTTGMVNLAKIPGNTARLSAGGLTELAEAGTSVGIALALYPVLCKRSQGLALSAVVFRTIEAVMYTLAGVITLSLPGLARQYAHGAAPGHSTIQAIGNALAGVRQYAELTAVLAYITGALMYYTVLYRYRLVPRWLAGWGIAAEALLLAAAVSAAFSHTPITSYTILIIPIAVQEQVLALWLIIRGFSPEPGLTGLRAASSDR